MRQLTGFLALTVAVAYLTVRPAWYRVTVIGSAVPIAMTANVTRVVLTGFIMHVLNPEFASGAFHTAEGLLMMALGLALLRAECWVLDQVVALTRPPAARLQPRTPAPHGGVEVRLAAPLGGQRNRGRPARVAVERELDAKAGRVGPGDVLDRVGKRVGAPRLGGAGRPGRHGDQGGGGKEQKSCEHRIPWYRNVVPARERVY